MKIKLFIISMLFLLCAGCQTVQTFLKPALTGDGEVFVYIQPLPQEANNLRFNLEEVYAVRNDGVEVPLALSLAEFKGSDPKRQRFVASGTLVPGVYRGLSFKASKAVLQGAERETELVVSDKREPVDFSFEVRRKKAGVIMLAFKFRESVGKGTGFKPVFSISIPPKPLTTLTGYATNYAANTITVFDKRSGDVQGMVATGKGPKSVVFDRSGNLAYVVISGEDAIEVLDLQANDIINRIQMNTGDKPSEAALTPDGKTLLVVNAGSNTVSFIDPSSNFETSRINVGNRPLSLLIDSTGNNAYVFNYLSNTISVIYIPNKTITATLPTESAPIRGTFNRKGDQLIVFHEWSPNLIAFNTTYLAIVKRIYAGTGVSFIKVDTSTDRLYVAKKHENVIDIYEPFSAIPIDSLKVSGWASYLLIDDEDNNLLLVLPEQNALQSINLISKKSRFIMDSCTAPYWSSIIGER